MKTIAPCLWFDNRAEEAVTFYTSIFPDAKVTSVSRYGDAAPGEPGQVMVMNFELQGQGFMALNGGPQFSFTEAISFLVNCENQEEVDRLWDELLAGGGKEAQCGWLKDRFGVSWQIIPTALGELMSDPDPEKAQRVTEALLQMVKIDIDTLQKAYDG